MPSLLHTYGLPTNHLADLVDTRWMLAHLTLFALRDFATTHLVSLEWLQTGKGDIVADTHLEFEPNFFIQRVLDLSYKNELLSIYLFSLHSQLHSTVFSPVWPVLQLAHPLMGRGYPVYESWSIQQWHRKEERVLLKAAFRYLKHRFGSSPVGPKGVHLSRIGLQVFDKIMHPAHALIHYDPIEWDLGEALGAAPEPGEPGL